jgi:hypothetical protein
MHQQVAKPYDKFQFSENIISLCFHEHKNSKLTHFSSISKEANFRVLQVLNMGDEKEDTPIILGRPFLNTTNAIIYIGSGQIHFQFPNT